MKPDFVLLGPNSTARAVVYAKGHEPEKSHQIKRTGVTIHGHMLDLSLPPVACSTG